MGARSTNSGEFNADRISAVSAAAEFVRRHQPAHLVPRREPVCDDRGRPGNTRPACCLPRGDLACPAFDRYVAISVSLGPGLVRHILVRRSLRTPVVFPSRPGLPRSASTGSHSPPAGGANARSRPVPPRVPRSVPRPSSRPGHRRHAAVATRSICEEYSPSARGMLRPPCACRRPRIALNNSSFCAGVNDLRGRGPPARGPELTTTTHSSIFAYCTQNWTGHDDWIPGSRPTRLNGLAMSPWYRSSLCRRRARSCPD